MFGLTMIKDYLNEILDGSRPFDARSYSTSKICFAKTIVF